MQYANWINQMPRVELIGVPGVPLIDTGDDLAGILAEAIRGNGLALQDDDVIVITSKVISKSEGRWVNLNTVSPDAEAHRIAAECGKDPREVTVILGES